MKKFQKNFADFAAVVGSILAAICFFVACGLELTHAGPEWGAPYSQPTRPAGWHDDPQKGLKVWPAHSVPHAVTPEGSATYHIVGISTNLVSGVFTNYAMVRSGANLYSGYGVWAAETTNHNAVEIFYVEVVCDPGVSNGLPCTNIVGAVTNISNSGVEVERLLGVAAAHNPCTNINGNLECPLHIDLLEWPKTFRTREDAQARPYADFSTHTRYILSNHDDEYYRWAFMRPSAFNIERSYFVLNINTNGGITFLLTTPSTNNLSIVANKFGIPTTNFMPWQTRPYADVGGYYSNGWPFPLSKPFLFSDAPTNWLFYITDTNRAILGEEYWYHTNINLNVQEVQMLDVYLAMRERQAVQTGWDQEDGFDTFEIGSGIGRVISYREHNDTHLYGPYLDKVKQYFRSDWTPPAGYVARCLADEDGSFNNWINSNLRWRWSYVNTATGPFFLQTNLFNGDTTWVFIPQTSPYAPYSPDTVFWRSEFLGSYDIPTYDFKHGNLGHPPEIVLLPYYDSNTPAEYKRNLTIKLYEALGLPLGWNVATGFVSGYITGPPDVTSGYSDVIISNAYGSYFDYTPQHYYTAGNPGLGHVVTAAWHFADVWEKTATNWTTSTNRLVLPCNTLREWRVPIFTRSQIVPVTTYDEVYSVSFIESYEADLSTTNCYGNQNLGGLVCYGTGWTNNSGFVATNIAGISFSVYHDKITTTNQHTDTFGGGGSIAKTINTNTVVVYSTILTAAVPSIVVSNVVLYNNDIAAGFNEVDYNWDGIQRIIDDMRWQQVPLEPETFPRTLYITRDPYQGEWEWSDSGRTIYHQPMTPIVEDAILAAGVPSAADVPLWSNADSLPSDVLDKLGIVTHTNDAYTVVTRRPTPMTPSYVDYDGNPVVFEEAVPLDWPYSKRREDFYAEVVQTSNYVYQVTRELPNGTTYTNISSYVEMVWPECPRNGVPSGEENFVFYSKDGAYRTDVYISWTALTNTPVGVDGAIAYGACRPPKNKPATRHFTANRNSAALMQRMSKPNAGGEVDLYLKLQGGPTNTSFANTQFSINTNDIRGVQPSRTQRRPSWEYDVTLYYYEKEGVVSQDYRDWQGIWHNFPWTNIGTVVNMVLPEDSVYVETNDYGMAPRLWIDTWTTKHYLIDSAPGDIPIQETGFGFATPLFDVYGGVEWDIDPNEYLGHYACGWFMRSDLVYQPKSPTVAFDRYYVPVNDWGYQDIREEITVTNTPIFGNSWTWNTDDLGFEYDITDHGKWQRPSSNYLAIATENDIAFTQTVGVEASPSASVNLTNPPHGFATPYYDRGFIHGWQIKDAIAIIKWDKGSNKFQYVTSPE